MWLWGAHRPSCPWCRHHARLATEHAAAPAKQACAAPAATDADGKLALFVCTRGVAWAWRRGVVVRWARAVALTFLVAARTPGWTPSIHRSRRTLRSSRPAGVAGYATVPSEDVHSVRQALAEAHTIWCVRRAPAAAWGLGCASPCVVAVMWSLLPTPCSAWGVPDAVDSVAGVCGTESGDSGEQGPKRCVVRRVVVRRHTHPTRFNTRLRD